MSFVNNDRTVTDAFASAVSDFTEDPDYDQSGLDLWQEWLQN